MGLDGVEHLCLWRVRQWPNAPQAQTEIDVLYIYMEKVLSRVCHDSCLPPNIVSIASQSEDILLRGSPRTHRKMTAQPSRPSAIVTYITGRRDWPYIPQ
jgi:hypothetical protein